MEADKNLVVPDKPGIQEGFRPGMQEPEITFGRCMITGEFGPTVAINPGEIALEMPNLEDGVEYDPETKEVTFTKWKPSIIEQRMTLSRRGLELLLGFMEGKELPVPAVTPELVYQWRALYEDGSTLSQYSFGEDGLEHDINSKEIDWPRTIQMQIVPRGDRPLPPYTFVFETRKFYRSGQEIDVDYDYDQFVEGAKMFYARSVTLTFGSGIKLDGLTREIHLAHTTVLQLVGWHTYEGGPKCIIAIDERGNWRPWEYA